MFDLHDGPHWVSFRIRAPLDVRFAANIYQQIEKTLDGRSEKPVILDLAAVDYIDWFGFEATLAFIEKYPNAVILAAVQPEIAALFRLSKLDLQLKLFADLDEATHLAARLCGVTTDANSG